MAILVTGATGFVGGHLTELLTRRKATVVALSRSAIWPRPWARLTRSVPVVSCDLGDGRRVEAVLRDVQPEAIYHLAGYASPGRSFAEPDAAWAGNLTATRSLYDAVIRWGGRPRILFVGTAQVYGEGDKTGMALNEDAPLRPSSPYAASKAAADLASYQYGRSSGLDVVRVRPFNHIGPGQSADYAIPNFARQIAAIARGKRPALLETGNLDSRRDLTDVRDVVEAYALLMERGRSGEAYNVATGQSWTMREVLDRLLALAGLAVEIRRRADLVRTVDPPAPVLNVGKLQRDTGWRPRHALDETLADVLDYWKQESSGEVET
jgi:GDP-4-dehydro-6-deoxy-D-mannose reductase